MTNPYDPGQAQSLTDHLSELRDRLVRSALAIAIGTALSWYFGDLLFEIVRAPIAPYLPAGGLVFVHPVDKFMAYLKVAALGGMVLACPVWIYQVYMFTAPGLYAHERKYSLMFIAFGTLLFGVGVSFAYFLALPTALQFLLTFGGTVDKPMITIAEYLSFFMTMVLVFGAAFELPLVLVLLGLIGIVDQKFLRAKRRYAILALAVFSAIITPPDALSMMLLLVPLVLLYEISIILVGIIKKRPSSAEKEEGSYG